MHTPHPFRAHPTLSFRRTITCQAVVLGLLLIAGLWVIPTMTWRGSPALHIMLEFTAGLLALVVAIGGIVRYVALGQRLVLLFGLSFMGAGAADLLHAAISLRTLTSGEGVDPATWTAGRLTLSLLLLVSLLVDRYAPHARRIRTELFAAVATTIVITGITTLLFIRYQPLFPILFVNIPPFSWISWMLTPLFLVSAWGYWRLFVAQQSSYLDWAAASAIIFSITQLYAAVGVEPHGPAFVMGHALKGFGYLIALIGLYMETLGLFRDLEVQREALQTAYLRINDQNRDLERSNRHLATLLDLSRMMAAMHRLDDLLHTILEKAIDLIPPAETGALLLYHPAIDRLVPEAAVGSDLALIQAIRLRPGETFAGRVFTTGQPYISHSQEEMASAMMDLRPENRLLLEQGAHRLGQRQGVMCAPLIVQNQPIGVMMVHRYSQAEHFTDDHLSFFQALCNHAATAIRNVQLYDEVQQYASQLSQKNRELESFVYTVSHDLRSPLVSLHGLMAMFTKAVGATLDERGKRYIARLEANASQMEELIDGLLELSRIGRAAVQVEDLDMGRLVDEVIDQLRPQLEAGAITVTVHPLPPLAASRVQMKQVFSNLIGNAIKFMGDTQERWIEVGGESLNGQARFYVRDTGIGIDPAYHEKVFMIFQRLQELEGVKGTGVGLAIVKKIIENAGGTIIVQSEKGKGATFVFTLPSGGSV